MVILLALAGCPEPGSNLCGHVVRDFWEPPATGVTVWRMNEGTWRDCPGDTAGASDGEVVAAALIEGDFFQATVPVGDYSVEPWSTEYQGCARVSVPDTTTCAGEAVVDYAVHPLRNVD